MDVNQIHEKEIIHVFSNGKTLAELPSDERPLFVLKWGPPGSGKSSAKVNTFIAKLGVPQEDYLNYSSDSILENLIPFRFQSAMAKAEYERIKALVDMRDFAGARSLLRSFAIDLEGRYSDKAKLEIKAFLEAWPERSPVKKESFDKTMNTFLYNKTRSAYNYQRRAVKNDTGLTIRDKMLNVLKLAYDSNKHIQYESSGLGYGEVPDVQILANQFSPGRIRRALGKQSVETVFKNTQEELLGRIIYDEANIPIRVEPVSKYTVPENYRIIVVYPILPRELIAERASLRASKMFFQKKNNIMQASEIQPLQTYKDILISYATQLRQMLGGETASIMQVVDRALAQEKAAVLSKVQFEHHGEAPYTEYIDDLLRQFRGMTEYGTPFSFPFYRALAPSIIMDSVEQAFQYSIDYFLKQYLLLGRIEQIIYINTQRTA